MSASPTSNGLQEERSRVSYLDTLLCLRFQTAEHAITTLRCQ
jgi:hypothetical protein